MPIDYGKLQQSPRLLLEANLKPVQGERFQPTGFADLGAARYSLPDGTEMLLVESAQSIANRMELACWDEAAGDWIAELKGMPYVRIRCGELGLTSTVLEFHRLNSPYIWEGQETESTRVFREAFLKDLGIRPSQKRKKRQVNGKGSETQAEGEGAEVPGALDLRKLHRAVFKWDTNAVLHGVFLEKIAGRLRMTRALGGFIEARGVRVAESGGTKVDQMLPSPSALGLSTKRGFGNVPYHRTEFVAEEIKACFNLDLALLRGYGLEDQATRLLIALALFKIRRFLSTGLRLRAACDLEAADGLRPTRPEGLDVPDEEALLEECGMLIAACGAQGLFAQPAITEVDWQPPPKKKNAKKGDDAEAEREDEDQGDGDED